VWQVLPQANRRIASVRAVSEAIAAVFRQRRAGGVREPARVRRQGR